jgi:hypothetical protein
MFVLFDVAGAEFLVLLNRRVVVIASNQPFDVKKSPGRILYSFSLTSSVFEKGNVRRCNAISRFVDTNIYAVVPPNTYARIRRSQINPDAGTFHDCAAATILVGVTVTMWNKIATFRHKFLCYEVVRSRAGVFSVAFYVVDST